MPLNQEVDGLLREAIRSLELSNPPSIWAGGGEEIAWKCRFCGRNYGDLVPIPGHSEDCIVSKIREHLNES